MKPLIPYEVFYSKRYKGYIARRLDERGDSAFAITKKEALRMLGTEWPSHQELVTKEN